MARPDAVQGNKPFLTLMPCTLAWSVYGVWQRDDDSGGEVRHLIAQRLVDLTPLLGGLATQSREFH